VRELFRDEVIAGVLGAAFIAAIEVVALGSGRPGVFAPAVALILSLGAAIGAVMAIAEWTVERLRPSPLVVALIRAGGAVIPLIPVGRSLFSGGLAATLPGAAWAPLWVPALGVLGIAAAALAGARLCRGWGPVSPRAGRAIAVAALALLAGAAELANRLLYPTEYPVLHLFLIVCSCAALAVALRVAGGAAELSVRRRRRVRAAIAFGVAVALGLTLFFGLESTADRWQVAEARSHSLRLSRLVRDLLDFDGDGYAAVLGGGDCDDADPDRNPGARDVPGNGIDEDCDGADAAPPAPRVTGLSASERRRYLASDGAVALRQRAAAAPLIVLSIDALRADLVAPGPESRRRFPVLSGLLGESVWFRRAVSPSAGTDVSLSCLVTGRVDPFAPIETTLWEAVAASGRIAHGILPREILRWAPRTLITRGLGSTDTVVNDRVQRDVGSHTTSAETTDRALAALDRIARQGESPPALWVHYFDVHEHGQIELGDPGLRSVQGDEPLDSTPARYRALLALTDREIGRLLAGLRERGLYEKAVIMVLSDHGESLGEDPRLPDRHGLYVYHPLTAIPLAIRVPGVAGREVFEPVSLLDVYPTLADLVGLEPAADLDGSNLVLHLLPDGPEPPIDPGRALPLNESDQWGVIVWPDKLMVRPADNLVELYDLEADPGERHNLAAARPARVTELKARYHAFPTVSMDRSVAGRRWRERQARPPRPR
jgi:hypothetical protein